VRSPEGEKERETHVFVSHHPREHEFRNSDDRSSCHSRLLSRESIKQESQDRLSLSLCRVSTIIEKWEGRTDAEVGLCSKVDTVQYEKIEHDLENLDLEDTLRLLTLSRQELKRRESKFLIIANHQSRTPQTSVG
jgi:hypothetical protein